MTFAVRNIGWVSGKRWEFVAISAVQTAAGNLSLPATVLAGDVAIVAGSDVVAGSAPSGFTIIAGGSSLAYYRICSGGETTAGRPTAAGHFYTLLYRPVGGSASFHAGATDWPAANRSMTVPSDKLCLVVGIGNIGGEVVWSAPTMPETLVTRGAFSNPGASVAAQVSDSLLPLGTGSTGTMKLNASTAPRQTFGIFTL